jgi:hypothetical protein
LHFGCKLSAIVLRDFVSIGGPHARLDISSLGSDYDSALANDWDDRIGANRHGSGNLPFSQ